jgi:hypothetical protein
MSIAATLAEQDLPDGPGVGEHEDDSLGTMPNVGGSLHLPGSTSALSRPAVRFQTARSCPALNEVLRPRDTYRPKSHEFQLHPLLPSILLSDTRGILLLGLASPYRNLANAFFAQ